MTAAPTAPAGLSVAEVWEGWIRWDGGECPLPEGTRHQVRYRDGFENQTKPAIKGSRSNTVWEHDADTPQFDIVAYRVAALRSAAEAARAGVQS